MTGIYPGGLQLSAATDLGTVSANSTGPILNAGASSYVKGAWTQVVASLSQDVSWMIVYIETMTSSGTNYAVDIGVGSSGSEVAIVSNLYLSAQSAIATRFMFPLTIPAGTRVSARAAGNGSPGGGISIGLSVFSDSYQSAGGSSSAVDTYGFSNSTILGTAIDAGSTANTKGAYAQITASTVADIGGIFAMFDTQNSTSDTTNAQYFLVDIAVGASGSEVVILPNTVICGYLAAGSMLFAGYIPYIPLQIKAGSRIAVRAQCSTNVSPDRILGCTIWGVRL